ncbi:MAG: energy transducer TonB [Fibromonadaceae bacterium]|nr:energy transducer TonB [Fibromonadaceae bacterium]
MKTFRKIFFFVLAVATSVFLVFSIPILNKFFKGDFGSEKTYTKTEISIINPEKPPEPPKPKEATRKPSRQNTNSRTPKAGPRFAMSLDVVGGSGGVAVPSELAAMQSGSGNLGSGDVDEKPALRSSPRFQPPQAIRDAEINANLRISFCVNANGRPYDIRIIEETPAGKGLANAGRDAVMGMQFAPAKKGGNAVSFCGMEQPFEVKFRE